MPDLSNLLQPIRVHDVEIRNRIMMTAHVTNMADHNLPSDQHVAYYAERARGGIGLIVMGFPQVHPTSQNTANDVKAFDDRIVPGLHKIAEAVHEHGARIFMQLGHAGRQAPSIWSERELWAPSAIPCPVNRELPKAMEVEDIDEIVDAHAAAALRAQSAGFDGVEIHSGYGGYLLSSFVSPYMNFRDDEYGGSLDNRLRLALRVAQAVRDAVGNDYVVGMQTQGHDYSPGGIDLPQAKEIAQRLVATNQLDYLVVKASTYFVASQNVPDMQHPPAIWLDLAAAIKEAVEDFPVFAVGRITDPAMASDIIATGKADMVAMTRQHIADPLTVNKIAEGHLEDIRSCIACNQGCIDRLFKGNFVTCVHNPAAGYERELGEGTLVQTDTPRRIIVIGAGPAGLKVAETAARRGHDVSLFERRSEVGGQLRLAAMVPERAEVGKVIKYLDTQVRKLPVALEVDHEMGAQDVRDLNADAVVIATGSRPRKEIIGYRSFGVHKVDGLEAANVITVWDVLEDGHKVGDTVLVVDDGEGSWKGIALALDLQAKGHHVHVATPLPYVGAALGAFTQNKLIGRLFEAEIACHPFTMIGSVTNGSVRVTSQGKEDTLTGIDTVILAGWHHPEDELYLELKGSVPEIHRIGDAVASRTMLEAIHGAERVARAL